jgi:hypothetical protein
LAIGRTNGTSGLSSTPKTRVSGNRIRPVHRHRLAAQQRLNIGTTSPPSGAIIKNSPNGLAALGRPSQPMRPSIIGSISSELV